MRYIEKIQRRETLEGHLKTSRLRRKPNLEDPRPRSRDASKEASKPCREASKPRRGTSKRSPEGKPRRETSDGNFRMKLLYELLYCLMRPSMCLISNNYMRGDTRSVQPVENVNFIFLLYLSFERTFPTLERYTTSVATVYPMIKKIICSSSPAV